MTQYKIRAFWSLIIWSAALIAIVIIFFSGGGAKTFLEGESKNTLTRVCMTAGFILYFAMLFFTRIRTGGEPHVRDERDETIARRAYSISFPTLLSYVFLLCGILYVFYKRYQDIRLIPLGWLLFIAWSSVLVGFISNAVAYLIIDARMSGHGES
jgi:hypothetical protein